VSGYTYHSEDGGWIGALNNGGDIGSLPEITDELNKLERELAEARKAATHQQNGRTASAQGWALLFEAAIEQRDMLAEALRNAEPHMRHKLNCNARLTDGELGCNCGMIKDRVAVINALAAVKGGGK
jgi:hypothetical protein